MIPIHELSVGNRIIGVYDKENELSEEVKVVCLDDTKEITEYQIWADGTQDHYEAFEPIPLTEEWLRKFQLPRRKIKTENPYYQYSIRDDFEIYCYMDGSGNCLFWGESSLQNAFFIIKCDTVHVFQNTYAVLNPHKKLTIK